MKLISLNIEGDSHLGLITPFLRAEMPDVICLQEIFELDMSVFEKALSMEGMFIPTVIINRSLNPRLRPKGKWGISMFARKNTIKWRSNYYHKIDRNLIDGLPIYTTSYGDVSNKAVLIGECRYNGAEYKIITTHFTWSAEGQVTGSQKEHLKKLFAILDREKEFVLCGDFNSPRGKEIWDSIALRYTDNIPKSVQTTIDNSSHQYGRKNRGIYLVVDGMFSTPSYKVSNVRIVQGVSDHCAIIGEVFRK